MTPDNNLISTREPIEKTACCQLLRLLQTVFFFVLTLQKLLKLKSSLLKNMKDKDKSGVEFKKSVIKYACVHALPPI